MIDQFLKWLEEHTPVHHRAEEENLKQQVREEHVKLHRHRARASRVLADFHRADEVIRGNNGEYR